MKKSADLPVSVEKIKPDAAILPVGEDTGHRNTGCCGKFVIPFGEKLWNDLPVFGQLHDASRFITLLAAFRVLLDRYNYDEDICMWNAIEQDALPYGVPLHTETKGEMLFTTVLSLLQGSVIESEKEKSGFGEGAAPCRAMFVMQQVPGPTGVPPRSSVAGEAPEFDLIFIVTVGSVPQLMIEFNVALYPQDMVRRMAANYMQLLRSVLSEPEQKIGAIPMLTTSEKHDLEVFNDTARPYCSEKTIVDLFEAQAAKTPGNIALYHGDQYLSYREVNERANRLAHHLIAIGVQKEDNVGLLTSRNFDLVIGLFAILKAGAAYVPIETSCPVERQQYILAHSSARFIMSNIDHSLNNQGIAAVDMRSVNYDNYSAANPGLTFSSTQLAYTIYTSGSTGVPKGVMIEHHSAVNLISWVNKEFNVGENDCLLFITSISFDLSVYDVFGMLSSGGSVVIAAKEDVLDIPGLAGMIQRYQITFWNSVPTTLDYLVGRLTTTYPDYLQNALRLVFLSGDWIPVGLPEKVKKFFPNAHVISLGGATEGTVWSNYYPVMRVNAGWHSIPYGKPITNNTFYILNEQLQPVPSGAKGELYIGGVGVARGYSNDPEKTRNAFLPDPFTARFGGRMYKTGDLGRMLPDGNMEFIGRKDNQVKIRGHRVELSEIECVIRENNTVSNAVVLHHDDKKQLIGYVVPADYYDRDAIIAHLKKKLPEYMVPAKWVELESMPLTTNGKMDIKALREIDIQGNLKTEFVAPRNELERLMATIWQQVLGAKEVGIHDNFFDMGGQSLVAVELITEMEKRTGKQLPVNILYKHPTIAQLSAFIGENAPGKKWKSLVTIQSSGNKTPLYIVHGDGLSISNFHNLAKHLDINQPVYGLQPRGLHDAEEPLESINDIARHYISEILEHNPSGPFVLAGYSFGGYVAIEMKKQLESMAKTVKMLAIFDTDAQSGAYSKHWVKTLPRRIVRQVPKFLFIIRSMLTRPIPTVKYQYVLFSQKINNLCYKLGIKARPELKGINVNIERINETNLKAFRNFQLSPFDDKIHLFKAKSRLYFVDDFKYLGWTNYALKGVNVYDVPGDHRTIFQPPNVGEMGKMLQHALDNC